MLIDLSHTITDGMITYPGIPAPVIETVIDREESAARLDTGVSFHIATVRLAANTGTYMDAPFHFHEHGPDVADLALDRLVDVPATIIRGQGRAIGADQLPRAAELRDHAVLVHTGHARAWGSDAYFVNAPYLTADAVVVLVAAGPALVGIDSLNIDDVDDLHRPAHHGLLGAGVPIVEHLTALDQLPDDRSVRFTAIPAPVQGMGTFPVRAVASFWGGRQIGPELREIEA